jgi:transcriptional antiterminator RfaH
MTGWYVVYTQAQAEAQALDHLRRQGYVAYLPRYQKRRRHARRWELVHRPLFPRYLFVALDMLTTRWRPILSTIGVSDLVRHADAPVPVPDGIIEEIRRREETGIFDTTRAGNFKAGDLVRAIEGPFAELIGRFHSMADAERVFVLFDLLDRLVKTRLASEAIAPA